LLWKDSIVIFYLGEKDDNVIIKETREINFEEILLQLYRGNAIFMTVKPSGEEQLTKREDIT
jgi:hypothetical protein